VDGNLLATLTGVASGIERSDFLLAWYSIYIWVVKLISALPFRKGRFRRS
jgi:hypothetical protein